MKGIPPNSRRQRFTAAALGLTAGLPDCSVPHQRHQHARGGGRDREHDGYCEHAQVRPLAVPVGGLRRTRGVARPRVRMRVDSRGRHGKENACPVPGASIPLLSGDQPDARRFRYGRKRSSYVAPSERSALLNDDPLLTECPATGL